MSFPEIPGAAADSIESLIARVPSESQQDIDPVAIAPGPDTGGSPSDSNGIESEPLATCILRSLTCDTTSLQPTAGSPVGAPSPHTSLGLLARPAMPS